MVDNKNIYYLNGEILSFFLFQYSLLIPLMGVVNSSLLVLVTSLILIIYLVYKNNKVRVNSRVLIFMTVVVFALLINTLITDAPISGIVYFCMIAMPIMVVFFYQFDSIGFLNRSYSLAYINFALLCWNPYMPGYAYMRFGYGMLLTVVFLYIKLLYGKYTKRVLISKLIDLIIMILSLCEMLVYGSRGAFLSFLILVILERFCINKTHIIKNSLIVIIVLIVINNIMALLSFFEDMSKKIGIYSYSITKFRMQLELGFSDASSGRTQLYQEAYEKITQHPIIGNGIYAVEDGNEYSHNIFIQVAQDVGIPALVVLVVLLISIIIYISRKTHRIENRIMITLLFSISIGRLLFSSTLWRRPEFWMLMFCYIVELRINGGNNKQQEE